MAAAVAEGRFGVVASSRYLPEGTPEGAELPLETMSRWEIVRLMTWMPTLRRLPHEERAWLAERVDGHPRTVEYLEVLARQAERRLVPPGGRFAGDWRGKVLAPVLEQVGERLEAELLLPRVWEALDGGAREHLGQLSVLTAPAPWEAVLALEAVEGTGRTLIDSGLLSPFQASGELWWAPHRLVSEMVAGVWEGDVAAAHRRLGAWFRVGFEEKGLLAWAQRAVEHLCSAGEANGAWPTAQKLVLFLRGAGRYREALSWVERVLTAGPSGETEGMTLLFDVQLRRNSGSLSADGETKLQKALGLVMDSGRGWVLHELGAFCQATGRLAAATVYLQQAVDAKAENWGEETSDVATSLHELAGVLKAQGDLAGAREKLERSLEISATVFGTEDHPDVAASLHELAGVLQAQGDLAGAREKLERSLEIKATVFGTEDHPDVAASLHELAGVLKAQGDLAGAREKLERVLDIEATVYGTRDHYSTAITEMVLGFLLFQLDEKKAGAELLAHAYGVFQRRLGPDHPYTRQLAPFFQQDSDPTQP